MRFRSPCKLIHDQPQIGVNDTSPSAVASSMRHYRNLQRVRPPHVSHRVPCCATVSAAEREVLSIVMLASHGCCRHLPANRSTTLSILDRGHETNETMRAERAEVERPPKCVMHCDGQTCIILLRTADRAGGGSNCFVTRTRTTTI